MKCSNSEEEVKAGERYMILAPRRHAQFQVLAEAVRPGDRWTRNSWYFRFEGKTLERARGSVFCSEDWSRHRAQREHAAAEQRKREEKAAAAAMEEDRPTLEVAQDLLLECGARRACIAQMTSSTNNRPFLEVELSLEACQSLLGRLR